MTKKGFIDFVRKAERESKMQGFIEVTRKDDGKKMLLNVSGIDGVFPEAKGAFVSMRGSVVLFCPKISGYFVEETYWEVKEQIMREQPLNG